MAQLTNIQLLDHKALILYSKPSYPYKIIKTSIEKSIKKAHLNIELLNRFTMVDLVIVMLNLKDKHYDFNTIQIILQTDNPEAYFLL